MANLQMLAEVSIFQALDDEERRTLAAQLDEVRFAAGQMVFRRGDPGGAVYVVETGAVEISTDATTGERIVLETSGPGEFFGELSLLDGAARSTDATAIEDTLALRVDRTDLSQLFRAHPESALDFLTVMGRRLREADRILRYGFARNSNAEIAERSTLVQKVADGLAAFSGSIPFLGVHVLWFLVWILLNTGRLPGVPVVDPFPYGLLTMIVSLEAIFLSCFVLISQNRQAAKDRIRSEVEYAANIKAGLEVSQLHVKVDRIEEEVLGIRARNESARGADRDRPPDGAPR